MARAKGRAVWFVALVLSLTIALALCASAQANSCASYGKKACRNNDSCEWTSGTCVVPKNVCSGIQANKVGGMSKRSRCTGNSACRCSKKKKCGTCVANVEVGTPESGGPCDSPFYVNAGLTCGQVKNTCGGWKSLTCTQSGATCTGPDRTGGNALVAGEQCTYNWSEKMGNCDSPFYVNSGLTCGMVKNTCGGWKSLSCTKSGATCTGPDRTGPNALIAGEDCTYVWPKTSNPCDSPFYVNSGLTCTNVKNTCGGWKSLSCTKSGATCTGPDRTGPNALIAGEDCTYVWPKTSNPCDSPFYVNSGLTCTNVKNTCGGWKSLSCTKSGATCTGPDHTGPNALIAGEWCTYVWS